MRATLTAKEAAEYLGVSYWLILELVKRKELGCIRAGGRVLFRQSSLDEWMDQQESSVRQEPQRGVLRRIQ
ncbi:MAG: helix-turn-helix domain-containing protein [Bacillota bacterium]|nr:helix-turn-helix domain-containing protein [Bacillota bacterium]